MITQKIVAVVADVDGVQTSGQLYFEPTGNVSKTFCVHDGLAWQQLQQMGIATAWLTGRADAATVKRAQELKIEVLFAHDGRDKGHHLMQWLQRHHLAADQALYLGDDLNDVPAFEVVGWPIAVANATPIAKAYARRITTHNGGDGVIAEILRWIQLFY